MKKRLIFVVFLLIILPSEAFGNNGKWSIETIDMEGDIGMDTSICIFNENIFISYYDIESKVLKLASFVNGKWNIEIVDSGNVGMYSSIAVDSYGYIHISYGNVRGKLFYAFLKDGERNVVEIDKNSIIWESTSIAIDKLSHPHICYYDISRDDVWFLKHAYFDGKKWRIEIIDPDLIGFYNSKGASIAIDFYGRIHIAYFGWKGWDLKYAYFDEKWHMEKVDEEGNVGAYPSIAIDLKGYPHISYIDKNNLDLKYAKRINYEPGKPEKPKGKIFAITGREYFYETNSIDFDGDKIRYGWDWNGDNIVDEWTDFYESGNKVKISHSWDRPGIYKIKVMAEDEEGFLSMLSDEKIVFVIKSFLLFHLDAFYHLR